MEIIVEIGDVKGGTVVDKPFSKNLARSKC